ncbi:hypothetical protein D3C81_1974290 [compost metagenome]
MECTIKNTINVKGAPPTKELNKASNCGNVSDTAGIFTTLVTHSPMQIESKAIFQTLLKEIFLNLLT